MISRLTKLRIRRRIRRSKQSVEAISSQAGEGIEQHIVNRIGQISVIWRFMATWFSLFLLLTAAVVTQTLALSHYFQHLEPVSGGVYTEGILGDFTNPNPIYASGSVDSAVSHLVFAGLLTYDNQGQLVGNLAKNWSVDSTGKVYTVTLKPHLTWQDGQPLTASDVVFTYQTIQNPDAQSPLNQAWQSVKVTQSGPLTVVFNLSNVLTSFPYSLTNGIIPQHILGGAQVATLRTNSFNTSPVGAGPFKLDSISVEGGSPTSRQEQISLLPFTNFNSGKPKLDQFVIRAFHDQSAMTDSFLQGQINGIAGLDSEPRSLNDYKNLQTLSLPLNAAEMVFFKTSSGIMNDATVRKALVMGANTNQILSGLGYPVIPVREPLLSSQVGYNASDEQFGFNASSAAASLQSDGWLMGNNGVRVKNGQQLSFTLCALDNQDDRYITDALKKQWAAIGVNLQVNLQDDNTFENTVTFHEYDALLYGISIGVDPDVFVYWDSSQASVNSSFHTNFSEYSSTTADSSLEAGRTRSGAQLRAVKYQPFLSAWQQDAPALGLYQPRFLYISDEPVYGLNEHPINDPVDRFDNVQNWEIRQARVTD